MVRVVKLRFWAAIEGAEPLPLELEGRHEAIDGFDLGIGKHRFVEGDSLGDVVIEPEKRRDGSHDGWSLWLGSDEPVRRWRGRDLRWADYRRSLATLNSVCVGSPGGRTGGGE